MQPVLFHLGPLTFYSYGLMLALGFFAGLTAAGRRAREVGVDPAKVQTLGLTVLLAGLAGARAAYVLLNWEMFRSGFWEVFRLDHGGLVFYGGLAGGLAAGVAGLKRLHLPGWRTVDLMIPPLVLAHAIGRIGCFFNGCCYGKGNHPTQLYESAFLFLLFFLLKALERRVPLQRAGNVAFTYGVLYGLWRFFIEFLRADNPIVAGGLTAFQWGSLFLIGGCLCLLLGRSLRGT